MSTKFPLSALNKKTSFLAWNIFDFLEKPPTLTDTHIFRGVEVKSPGLNPNPNPNPNPNSFPYPNPNLES